MDKSIYWELFIDTGAPEAFLLFRNQSRVQRDTDKESATNES